MLGKKCPIIFLYIILDIILDIIFDIVILELKFKKITLKYSLGSIKHTP